MGRCDCGSETDWTEIGGTWICVVCRGEETERLMSELKQGLEKMEETERSLQRIRVDTQIIPDLLGKLKEEMNKIKVS